MSSSLLTLTGFSAYMKELLKTKFPDFKFDDIDHYAGSLVVETTVSTSAGTKKGWCNLSVKPLKSYGNFENTLVMCSITLKISIAN